jgi:ketosteroid isomerase-like protein
MKTGVLGAGTPTNKERLLAAYAAYNRQDGAALLALVSEDVDWPDGSARFARQGRASGWIRQWAMTRTHDEPVEITDLSPDRSVVRIRQVVHALDGTKISEGSFDHLYRFQGGLIERMDIQNLEALPR